MAYKSFTVKISLEAPFNENGNVLELMSKIRNALKDNNCVSDVQLDGMKQ